MAVYERVAAGIGVEMEGKSGMKAGTGERAGERVEMREKAGTWGRVGIISGAEEKEMTVKNTVGRAGEVRQMFCGVRERLEDYKSLVLEIELLEEEKCRLRQGYLSARVLDGMPRAEGRSFDHVSELALRLIDMQKIIDQRLDLLIDTRMEIEGLFDRISSDERNLLRLRYIDGLGWEDISDKMAFSLQWLHILHRRALKSAEEINNNSKCR